MEIVIIAGATGMIGKALCKKLEEKYELVIITRNPEKAIIILGEKYKYISWDDSINLIKAVNNSFGVINLSGQNISEGRWTKIMKRKILNSRVEAGKLLIKAVTSCDKKPLVFIQSSAIVMIMRKNTMNHHYVLIIHFFIIFVNNGSPHQKK